MAKTVANIVASKPMKRARNYIKEEQESASRSRRSRKIAELTGLRAANALTQVVIVIDG